MIRLLIADDHPVVRDGLRGMLAGQGDLEVVGEPPPGWRPSASPSGSGPTWS